MLSRLRVFALALLTASLPTPGFARDGRSERIRFDEGRATVAGRIKGYDFVDYVFAAGAGESMNVRLKTNKGGNYFNLLAPGATDEAFFIGSTSGLSYEGVASTSGDYKARVYLMRNDARRGVAANYTLTVALGQNSAAQPNGPDFADGLTGGPDYWEVKGVPEGDRLNVRATPSPKGKTVTQVLNTAIMKNHGCRNTQGQRWCQVEDGAGRRGWVNGKFLREAAWPPQ